MTSTTTRGTAEVYGCVRAGFDERVQADIVSLQTPTNRTLVPNLGADGHTVQARLRDVSL
jgi:hypothetical protein